MMSTTDAGANTMQKEVVSLLEFVRTGSLGDLSLGDEMRSFGQRFGPPTSWEPRWENYFPAIWMYGDVQVFMEEIELGKIVLSYILIQPGYRRTNQVIGGGRLRLAADGIEPYMSLPAFLELMDSNGVAHEDARRAGLKPGVGAFLALNKTTFATFWHEDEDRRMGELQLSAIEVSRQ